MPERQDKQAPKIRLPHVLPGRDLLSQGPRIIIKEFSFTGNTVVETKILEKMAEPYLNRLVYTRDLQVLREAITRHYINLGYVNSGAVLPDQNIYNGRILIKIVEGGIERIILNGHKRLNEAFLRARIYESKEPLNINLLKRKLTSLQGIEGIARINALLKPGPVPGQSRLLVRIKESGAWRSGIRLDNYRPPSVGGEHAVVQVSRINTAGRGDRLNLTGGWSEGSDELNFHYSFPVNRSGTSLAIKYQQSAASLIEAPFENLVDSKSSSLVFELMQPWSWQADTAWSLGFSLEHRRNHTFWGGDSFSFIEGLNDGESKITVSRIVFDWSRRRARSVLAARSTISFGLDTLDASKNNSGPDARFTAWLLRLQWVRRVAAGQWLVSGYGQVADDRLLPLERFSAGGRFSVRGYRENQLVRDNGAAASVEWRYPLTAGKAIELALFYDYGLGENRAGNNERLRMESVGLGLRGRVGKGFQYEFYWGDPLRQLGPGNGEDLQDEGFHFSVWQSF